MVNKIQSASLAVIQDDTGIPYRQIDQTKWQVTLYGKYDKLFNPFTPYQQNDLRAAYRQSAKNLPFNIAYGAIREELDRMSVKELSIQAISQAVIHIRRSKLPDPAVIGNAGSFFKNPVLGSAPFTELRAAHPGIVGFPNPDGTVKLAAAWLIEQCGWKGYRKGDAGCHGQQALVLVNYGQASGAEILALSKEIEQSVKKKFGIELEREVNIV